MSGHKRTTVKLNQQDIYRLEQLSNRMRQVEQDYQDIQNKIQLHRNEQLNNITRQVENRQNEYIQVLGAYQNGLSRLEQETSQALLNNTLAMQEQLEKQESAIRRDAQIFIEQRTQSIQQVLQENQKAQFDHFQTIRQTMHDFRHDQERKTALAQEAVESALGLLQSIDQVYPHERYFPGALYAMQMDYELAAQNLHNGLPEAAIMGAQQVIQQISTLRMNIEEIMQNTSLMLALALEKVEEFSLTLDQNAFVPAMDLEGNQLETMIDVDFWSHGRFSSLRKRFAGFIDQLHDSAAELEYEDLLRIVKFVIPQLEQSLEDTIAQARLRIVLSQIRFNIAQHILEALAEQGFEIQEAIYRGNDERQPFQLISRNLEGSEVQVCVDSGEQMGAYDIQIDSIEPTPRTEDELRQRANGIMRSLQSVGLKVGTLQEIPQSQKPVFVVQSRQRMPKTAPGITNYVH